MTTATDHALAHATAQRRIATPLGTLLLARTDAGLAGAWFAAQKHHPPALAAPERDDEDPILDRATQQLAAYFAGSDEGFTGLALDLAGTPFQRAVWDELLKIEPGTTRTYGEIARRLGRPSASRAVGAAVGRNPVSIIVPCHRVVGGDGSMTGYAGGIDRKTALLKLEATSSQTTAAPRRPNAKASAARQAALA